MSGMKLDLSEDDRLHLKQMSEALAGIGDVGELASTEEEPQGCGGLCRITCSYYCRDNCDDTCKNGCQHWMVNMCEGGTSWIWNI